jgi:two-component system, chemotaxis family, CheB/CheR fusion protein
MVDRTNDELEPESEVRGTAGSGPSMVVGIGASAGGIGALSAFFARVQPEMPIAYVVILHLSPDHDSRLAEVLQATTRMPVTQVRETVALKPSHVYVIPPNQTLEVVDATLRLSPMKGPEERRAPVDMFFRTLADAYGPHAAAVVLSGTGPNGSNGLKRVKEYGGLTAAQDPNEAEYGDMPRNSIATGLVDFVEPVGDIPARILAYCERLDRDDAQIMDPPAPDADAPAAAGMGALRAAQDWRDILTVLRLRTGQDFSNYKPATLRRRVERRLNVRGLSSLSEYARLLREHPEEPAALMKELLISVTNFFRDPEAFLALERRVVPDIFSRKHAGDQVRVWSAGCATGEEAYSLAMLVMEHSSTLIDSPTVQVFATDLDEAAVAHAREGVYTEADVADISPERLQRFFQREAGAYRVRRELRETVLFAHHNVIRDPPFSHLDLIACRNLLIYLNRPVQERLIETFHFALRPGGFLFLGSSESADGDTDLFVAIDKTAHIYESRTVASRPTLPLADRSLPAAAPFQRLPEPQPPSERISPGDLHLRLLEQYSPPSFVVNEESVLLHASPLATRFLQMPAGEPSRDIFRILIPELRADVRTALHLAAQQRGPVEVGGIRLANAAGGQRLTVKVRPSLREDDPPRGYFLVVVEEETQPPDAPAAPPVHLQSPAEPESRRLEDELQRVKSQLRMTIEQYETHSEEARAANEELQAMNEELRSAAEELETSKEELQSVNEELTTVNQELKIKIEELGLTNNDFQNLINSTDIGTIFLDRLMRVKLSTPAAQKIFNLLPSDIGRRLSDITSRLLYDGLHDDILQVLDTLQTVEREVQTKEGRHYLMRILPYRTIDDRIDGVSMTFHDVSDWRQAESRVRTSEERLRFLVESAADYAILTMTGDGTIDSWNMGAERTFGYRTEEILGQDAAILFTPEDRALGIPAQELNTARIIGKADDERWHIRKDGTRFYCSGVVTRIGDGPRFGFAKIARDLTAQRQSEMELQNAHSDLEAKVGVRTAQLQAEVERHLGAQQDVLRLLHKLVTAQEDERARIARDLHDQLGQQLTALRLALERHRDSHHARGQADEDLERALALTQEVDSQVDFLAWQLRPAVLDDLGLLAALPRFLNEWSEHYGIRTDFQTTGQFPRRMSPDVETAFYRVTQEALNNVVKHAHATRVDVVLEGLSDAIRLVIEDDGVGFDAAAADKSLTGVGLANMRERAVLIGAVLQIETSPGKGTTIYLRYPRDAAAKA